MRAYKVTIKEQPSKGEGDSKPSKFQFAGTQSEATAIKKTYLEEAGLRPQADANQVTVEQVEIPTGKGDLIPFLNDLLN